MAQIDFTDTLPEGPMLEKIKGRESGNQNLPPQANYAYPRSHASGDFQIQPGTWRDWSRQFGIGAQAKEAYQAPEAQQALVSALALRKYGANSPYTWAASGPYREGKKQPQQVPQKPAGGLLDFSDAMPVGKTFTPSPDKAKGGLIDFGDTMPPHRTLDTPWRVPPAQEGPRANVRSPGVGPQSGQQFGPPMPNVSAGTSPNEQLRMDLGLKTPGQIQAEPFAADPSIAARVKQQPPQDVTAKVAGAAQWIKQNYPDLQIADMMGDLTNWAAGKGQGALETAFTKAGVPNAARAARDLTQYAVEFMPMQGGLGIRGFKPRPDLTGIKPPEAPGAGQPGTGVPNIPQPHPVGEAPVPPGAPAPFPKYEPIPGGGVHAGEEAPPVAEKPPEAAPPPPVAKPPEPPPLVHGGPSSPAPEVGPEVLPAEKPAVPPKAVLSPLDRVTNYLDALSDKFGLPRLTVEATINKPSLRGAIIHSEQVQHSAAIENFKNNGVFIPRQYMTPKGFIIYIKTKGPFQAWAAAHEFGHYIQYTKLLDADKATQDAIVAAWKRDAAAGIQRSPIHSAIAEEVTGPPPPGKKWSTAAQGYEKGFGEWFANQAARWLTTNKEATTLAGKFFKGVAAQWRKLYKTVTGKQGTAPEIDAFMRKHWDAQAAGQPAGAMGAGNNLGLSGGATPAWFGRGGTQAGPPTRPARDWIRKIEDGFQKVRGSSTADRAQIKQWVDSLPKEVRDPTLLGRLFAFGEGDRSVNLTPRERQYFDQYVQPMRDENRQLYNTLRNAGLKDDALDPDHMHRAVVGRTREYDPHTGFGSEETPVVGYKSTRPSAARNRQYYVLEDANGQRQVIWEHPKTGSVSTVSAGTHNPIKLDQVPKRGGGMKAPDIKPGESVTMGGQRYTVKNALTREIEANTSTRYYKNALASVIRANIQLKSANRLLDFLRDIKQSPEFQDWAKPDHVREADQLRDEGWRSPSLGAMPIFREFLMHPTLASAIEDFYGSMPAKFSIVEKLYKLTRFTVQSMFWSPLVHASNAAFHWTTARGIDWVNPMGYKRLASTVPRAIYETVTQGPKYQSLLRQGSGLVYGGLAQRDFFEHILRAVGENVVRQPSKWGPIADVLRVGTTDLVSMLYTGSAKALWAASDMMMVQRVLELEQKGMGTAEAIAEAEKHLPNYRIPTEVAGSRALAQGLKNVGLTEFSRYHYGMIKSVAHMARDLVSPKATLKERYEAMGSIMATGVLMAIVTPYLSKKLQQATGDEKIEYSPKGSTVIPSSLWDIFVTHKGNPFDMLNRMITINPVVKTAIEMGFNRDMFTGHNIVGPADLAKHPGRFLAREGDFAGQNLGSPYGTAVEGMKHGLGGLGEQILKQGVGARNKPKIYQSKGEQKYQASHRGPIEKGENWMEEYLRKLVPAYGGT